MQKKVLYVTSEKNDPFEIRYGFGTPEHRRMPLFHELLRTIEHEYTKGTARDFEIRLAPGTYYLSSPISLLASPSYPTMGAHISFVADGGEVILSGAKRIDGFQECNRNGVRALVADIPAVRLGEWDFEEIYVNKSLRKRAFLPKDGSLFRITGIPAHPPVENVGQANPAAFSSVDMRSFEAADGVFDGISHPEETVVHIEHFWVHERIPVMRYDAEKKLVHFSVRPNQPFVDSTNPTFASYYIENVREALHDAGEWYLDKREGKLYYLPFPDETADNILVEAPFLHSLVRVCGKAGDPFVGIRFEGITFEGTRSGAENETEAYAAPINTGREGALSLAYAEDVTIKDCTFRSLGNCAVFGNGGLRNITVERSCFLDLCSGAIALLDGDGGEQALRGARIENCRICRIGLIYPESDGVAVGGSHVLIAHNEISHTGYNGIAYRHSGGHYLGQTSHFTVAYNHIHHIGNGSLSDMGAIYVYGGSHGCVIRGNYIHDVYRGVYGGNGIYLDEDATHFLVEKNIVHRCASACLMIHFGEENVVRHNILGHGEACVSFGAQSRNDAETRAVYLNMFKNLLFVENNAVYQGLYNVTLEESVLETDTNFIYKTTDAPLYNRNKTKVASLGIHERTWEEWQAQGMDVFTLIFHTDAPVLTTPDELLKYGFPRLSPDMAGIQEV